MLLQNLLAHTDDGCGAAVALQAAFVAAGAGHAADVHGNVADLAAHAVEAAPRTAVDDDAAAHAGAQRQEHAGRGALAHARHALGKAGHGGVVVNKDGLVDVFLQLAAQGNVLPAHVGAEDDVAGLRVRNAGNADAHGVNVVHRQLGLVQHLQGAAAHVRDDLLIGAAHQRGGLALMDQLTLLVHHADLNAGSAYVNANVYHDSILPYCPYF